MSAALDARLAQEMARTVAAPIAERVAQETAAPIARETAETVALQTAQDAADAFHAAHPPLPGPKGGDGAPGAAGAAGQAGPRGTEGKAGPKGDKGLNWRGPWKRGLYAIDDVVFVDGSSWVATAPTRTKPPSKDWDPVALKGVDGASGIITATGGTSSGLPSGGTTGQVATKKSDADGDVGWETPTGDSGSFSHGSGPPDSPSYSSFDVGPNTSSTSGAFALDFGTGTTAPIAFDATVAELVAACELVVGAGNIRQRPGNAAATVQDYPTLQFIGDFGYSVVAAPTVVNDTTDGTGTEVFDEGSGDPGVPANPVDGDRYLDDDATVGSGGRADRLALWTFDASAAGTFGAGRWLSQPAPAFTYAGLAEIPRSILMSGADGLPNQLILPDTDTEVGSIVGLVGVDNGPRTIGKYLPTSTHAGPPTELPGGTGMEPAWFIFDADDEGALWVWRYLDEWYGPYRPAGGDSSDSSFLSVAKWSR